MNARTLMEVLLKFWGVVTLVSVTGPLPTFFALLLPSSKGYNHVELWSFAIGIVVTIAAGICLLRFAKPLSQVLIPGSEASSRELSGHIILEVALVALGVFLMISGFKFVAAVGVELVLSQRWVQVGETASTWARERGTFVSGATELVAGFLVIWFRRRVSEWLPSGAGGAA